MPKFEPISLESKNPYGGELAVPANPSGGRNLYLDDPRVIDLPECGCITFRFERGPVRVVEGDDSRPGSASVDLTLTEICDVKAEEGDKGEYSEPNRAANAIDELFESLRGEKEPEEGAQGEE